RPCRHVASLVVRPGLQGERLRVGRRALRPHGRRLLNVNAIRRLAAVLGFAAWATVVHAESWPEVKSPAGAQVQSIASDMIFNGRPARLFRFEANGGEQEVLAFFRDQFGAKKVVENRLKN